MLCPNVRMWITTIRGVSTLPSFLRIRKRKRKRKTFACFIPIRKRKTFATTVNNPIMKKEHWYPRSRVLSKRPERGYCQYAFVCFS